MSNENEARANELFIWVGKAKCSCCGKRNNCWKNLQMNTICGCCLGKPKYAMVAMVQLSIGQEYRSVALIPGGVTKDDGRCAGE